MKNQTQEYRDLLGYKNFTDRFSGEKNFEIRSSDMWEIFFGKSVRHSSRLFKVRKQVQIYQAKMNCSAHQKILFKKFWGKLSFYILT